MNKNLPFHKEFIMFVLYNKMNDYKYN